MRFTVNAGTDGGSVVLFDRGILPTPLPSAVADHKFADEEFFKMVDDGRLAWFSPGDGDFWLHAYVNEPVPATLEQFANDVETYSNFPVPTGTLYFVGMEYAFDFNDTMGSSFEIAPGKYSIRAFEVAYPKNFLLSELRKRVSILPYFLYRLATVFVTVILISCCGIVPLLAASLRNVLALYSAAILSLIAGVCIWLFFAPRKTHEEFLKLREEFPTFVAHFSRSE